MVVFPPCKINLGLHILSKRGDGYHNIETCFFSVPWTDALEIIPSDQFSFSSSGLSIPHEGKDNLCIQAYLLLKKDFDLPPVSIHLHKVIPTGAGLGGGSSNAAHTLKLLNEIFNLNLSTSKLSAYALYLGSDCCFFVHNSPMLGSGRGEILSPVSVDLKGKYLAIIKPDVHISTAEAYSNVSPGTPIQPLEEVLMRPIEYWKELLINDFEKSIFRKFPAIQSVKETFYKRGALYSSLSGSGSAVFGIFEREIDIKKMNHTYWASVL